MTFLIPEMFREEMTDVIKNTLLKLYKNQRYINNNEIHFMFVDNNDYDNFISFSVEYFKIKKENTELREESRELRIIKDAFDVLNKDVKK